MIRTWIIEIGGKGKGYSQFKGIEDIEKLVVSHYGGVEGLKRPLFTLGFQR